MDSRDIGESRRVAHEHLGHVFMLPSSVCGYVLQSMTFVVELFLALAALEHFLSSLPSLMLDEDSEMCSCVF